jgi:hypothetical protein
VPMFAIQKPSGSISRKIVIVMSINLPAHINIPSLKNDASLKRSQLVADNQLVSFVWLFHMFVESQSYWYCHILTWTAVCSCLIYRTDIWLGWVKYCCRTIDILMISPVLTFGQEVGRCHYYGISYLVKNALIGRTDMGE